MRRVVAGNFCLFFQLGLLSTGWAQHGPILPEVRVYSCAYADSLLGTEWEKGSITASRGADGNVLMISRSSGVIRTTIQMSVMINHREITPLRDPHGSLQMTVFD